MDATKVFCPNTACPATGRVGKGNIEIHSRPERRYMCTVCEVSFVETKGTPFYRLRTDEETVTIVLTLLAHGCPLPAIKAALGFDERTVKKWQQRSGQHCQAVHEHLVERPRDLGQAQADELRVKLQGGIVWMAMAMQVSTRLWLGGVVSAKRIGLGRRPIPMALIVALLQKVRACALPRPLLICVDGFSAYVRAIRRVFRVPQPRHGRRGRPRLKPWGSLSIAQVVKKYARHRVTAITRRIVQGSQAAVDRLIQRTQNGGGINTAFIERLNATFRARLGHLVRRTRGLAHQVSTLEHGMYLVGTIYNFCTAHDSLRLRRRGRPDAAGHRWHERTPAMAAGITDHCWTVHELLSYHVPPPRWTPPKRRGRKSKATRDLEARWCS